jgi:CheY-like chemotaxis protein
VTLIDNITEELARMREAARYECVIADYNSPQREVQRIRADVLADVIATIDALIAADVARIRAEMDAIPVRLAGASIEAVMEACVAAGMAAPASARAFLTSRGYERLSGSPFRLRDMIEDYNAAVARAGDVAAVKPVAIR